MSCVISPSPSSGNCGCGELVGVINNLGSMGEGGVIGGEEGLVPTFLRFSGMW